MVFRTLPTTLLHIFCKTILTFKVIVKNVVDPEDNFWRNSEIIASVHLRFVRFYVHKHSYLNNFCERVINL